MLVLVQCKESGCYMPFKPEFRYQVQRSKNKKGLLYAFGLGLTKALPWVIKSLSVIGTLALLLVSGGIFAHYIEFLHHFMEGVPGILRDFVLGLIVGIIALIIVKLFKAAYQRIFRPSKS